MDYIILYYTHIILFYYIYIHVLYSNDNNKNSKTFWGYRSLKF